MRNDAVKYIVAGLGNPGGKYTFTRHNAGFLALDYISQKHDFKIDRIKFNSLCGRAVFQQASGDGCGILFLKPQSYMNNSGAAVNEAARFYKLPAENVIVISDDISLPVGKIRIRRSGSNGGHNGLRSITEHLSSDAFPRIKIGVGDRPVAGYDLADWVLSEFSAAEQKTLFDTFIKTDSALTEIIRSGNIDTAMNLYN